MVLICILEAFPHAPSRCARGIAGLLLTAGLLAGGAHAQYTLLRGNLHAHTKYSDGYDSFYPDTVNPGAAANQARLNTLDVLSTSDHGEQISDSEWASTKTEMTNATDPGKFIGLWGFEWTASKDGAPLSASGLGHINVFGSDRRAGMDNVSESATTDPTDWVRRLWWNNHNGSIDHAGTLYQWILSKGASPLGGNIVGQFNHPSGMPGVSLANPSSRISEGAQVVIADWWRKLEWVPELDSYMTLMELGGRGVDQLFQPMQHNLPWTEPYYQLALDNGWHVAPTNNEDNHHDNYGQDVAPAPAPNKNLLLVSTGIWAEATTGLTRAQAQGKVLAALRERRTFSAEYKPGSHKDGASIKLTVNTVSGTMKWMGDRTLTAADVAGSRVHLEVKPGKGLTLSQVDIISNRGVVAKTLPVSGTGVTWTSGTAAWDFGLSGDTPGAQLRVCSDTSYATNAYANLPLAPTWSGTSRGVVLNAAASSHIERFYYVRVTQLDTSNRPYYAISAPIWIQRTPKTAASYRWDFGDGTPGQTVTVPSTLAPDTVYGEVTHNYPATGSVFYPRVTVTYSDGTNETSVGRVVFGAAPTDPFYGDVNGDGQVNGEDLALVCRCSAGLQGLSDAGQFNRANVNPPASGGAPGGTTKLDISDFLRLMRFVNGKVSIWP